MKAYARKNAFLTGFVLGISGGQDSTLVGKLAQLAVDELNREEGEERYKFIAVRLPYGTQFDEDDCQDALDFIGPTLIYTVNIKEAVDASERNLTAAGVTLTDYAKGNEKATGADESSILNRGDARLRSSWKRPCGGGNYRILYEIR